MGEERPHHGPPIGLYHGRTRHHAGPNTTGAHTFESEIAWVVGAVWRTSERMTNRRQSLRVAGHDHRRPRHRRARRFSARRYRRVDHGRAAEESSERSRLPRTRTVTGRAYLRGHRNVVHRCDRRRPAVVQDEPDLVWWDSWCCARNYGVSCSTLGERVGANH